MRDLMGFKFFFVFVFVLGRIFHRWHCVFPIGSREKDTMSHAKVMVRLISGFRRHQPGT